MLLALLAFCFAQISTGVLAEKTATNTVTLATPTLGFRKGFSSAIKHLRKASFRKVSFRKTSTKPSTDKGMKRKYKSTSDGPAYIPRRFNVRRIRRI